MSEERRKRQQELLQHRAGQNSNDWSSLNSALAVLFVVGLNVCAAFVANIAVVSGERIEVERRGKIVVSHSFLEAAENNETLNYSSEAKDIAEKYGGTQAAIEQNLRTISLGDRHLHKRRGYRHHDGGRDPHAGGVIGHRLGVIASRHRNNPAHPLRR